MLFNRAKFSIVAGLSLTFALAATPALADELQGAAVVDAGGSSAVVQAAESEQQSAEPTVSVDTVSVVDEVANNNPVSVTSVEDPAVDAEANNSSTVSDGSNGVAVADANDVQADAICEPNQTLDTVSEDPAVENQDALATEPSDEPDAIVSSNAAADEAASADSNVAAAQDSQDSIEDSLAHLGPAVPEGVEWQSSPETGWDNGHYYLSDGTMATGEQYLYATNDNTGERNWYYFDESGNLVYGWRHLDSNGGKWVYYDPTTAAMRHGEAYVGGSGGEGWCYFDDVTGATQYQWKHLDSNGGKWVYYDPVTGRMWHGEGYATGSGGDGWCYFDEVTGATQYKWKYLDSNGGKWVYYDDVTGRMYHGEAYVYSGNDSSSESLGKHWYYYDDVTGATTYGWKNMTDGRTVYYIPTWGWMAHGYYNVTDVDTYAVSSDTDYMRSVEESHDRSVTYYFDEVTGNWTVGSAAAWNAYNRIRSVGSSTNYMICVDLSNYRTVIFQGSAFNWTPIYDWLCGIGKTSNSNGGTYTGNYTLGSTTMLAFPRYFSAYGNHYWGVNMWEGFGFHSTLDGQGSDDQQLGREVSLACIRLHYGNAKWLYKHCPDGTPVQIYW